MKDYIPFSTPIFLQEVFKQQDVVLRRYLEHNSNRSSGQRRRLFFVVQSGRLRCLNGAYLTEVDDELAGLLLGSDYSKDESISQFPLLDVKTSEHIQELRARVGQREFSDKVRSNYGHQCCFPDCLFDEDYFLVASHIARWADVEEFRGNISNGLCLCLIHDKAFEMGLFTIDRNLRVAVNKDQKSVKSSVWYNTHLLPFDGCLIRCGDILPSEDALRYHWKRIGVFW